jgi:hypothetical protein
MAPRRIFGALFDGRRFPVRRFALTVIAAIVLTLTLALALPAGAGARTLWKCQVPEDGTTVEVIFVSAADAAHHGISVANSRAGTVFADQFGESCTVETG